MSADQSYFWEMRMSFHFIMINLFTQNRRSLTVIKYGLVESFKLVSTLILKIGDVINRLLKVDI